MDGISFAALAKLSLASHLLSCPTTGECDSVLGGSHSNSLFFLSVVSESKLKKKL